MGLHAQQRRREQLAPSRSERVGIILGQHFVPDDPRRGIDVPVDRREDSAVVHAAAIGKSVMQLVLFNPPRRTKPLEKGHCREHEPRLGVVSRAPLTVGEVMAEKCGAQIVEGEDNGARRRPAAAPPQQDEGEKRERHEFETAKRLFPGRDVKIPLVVRQRLECRHAPRKRSRIRIAHAAESGGRFEDIAQCFLVAPDLACFCFFCRRSFFV